MERSQLTYTARLQNKAFPVASAGCQCASSCSGKVLWFYFVTCSFLSLFLSWFTVDTLLLWLSIWCVSPAYDMIPPNPLILERYWNIFNYSVTHNPWCSIRLWYFQYYFLHFSYFLSLTYLSLFLSTFLNILRGSKFLIGLFFASCLWEKFN